MRWCNSGGKDASIVVHVRRCISRACETTGATRRERNDRCLRSLETRFPSEAIALPFEGRRATALLGCLAIRCGKIIVQREAGVSNIQTVRTVFISPHPHHLHAPPTCQPPFRLSSFRPLLARTGTDHRIRPGRGNRSVHSVATPVGVSDPASCNLNTNSRSGCGRGGWHGRGRDNPIARSHQSDRLFPEAESTHE